MNEAIADYVGEGWLVESAVGDFVTFSRRSRNWFSNTLMVLITFGLWFFYLIYRAFKPARDTLVIRVDDFGHVRIVRRTLDN